MSSSMRNAINRRPHRERAQPIERQRLGLLEKHKDYSLRAKDYNRKKAQIKALRRKAADRNEDEFYFGMLSRKGPSSFLTSGKRWDGTVAGDRGNKVLDMDVVRLLKTQDVGYIRTMHNVLAKEVASLEQRVLVAQETTRRDGTLEEEEDDEDDIDFSSRAAARPKKIVFAETEEEREVVMATPTAGRKGEDGDGGMGDEEFEGFEDEEEQDEKAVMLTKLRRSLAIAKRKLKTLADAEGALGEQRAKMAKTATSGGYTKAGKRIVVHKRKR